MRSEILELEHRTKPLLPPPSVTPTSPPGKFRDFSREYNDHDQQQPKFSASAAGRVGAEQHWFSTAAEEAVIEDAENGVRLVPLRKEFEEEQAAAGGLAEGRARGKAAKGDDDVGGDKSEKGTWRVARGVWRWMRGY